MIEFFFFSNLESGLTMVVVGDNTKAQKMSVLGIVINC